MNRFSQEHTHHDIRRRLVPSVVLTLGCVLFLWKFSSSVTETTNHAQMENLKQAILRSAVHCYAVEGIYPAFPIWKNTTESHGTRKNTPSTTRSSAPTSHRPLR